MAERLQLERNTRVLIWGMLLAMVIVSLVRLSVPPVTEWDVSNGHRTVLGRGYPSVAGMLLLLYADVAKIALLPVMGYIGVALVLVMRQRPIAAVGLSWALWAVSILVWVVFGDWWEMSN